jgi:nitroimidazol reductase NimA-like FMN-containing flavoprotein (pyridoxamine 5'-phosphate oxidase superfamily)
MSEQFAVTDRTRVRRGAARARYDRDTVFAILDEGLVCHIGHVTPDGRPVVLPTIYGRVGDVLYVHGSTASRMLGVSAAGPVCVTVTLLDGLVVSRSAFHHSMNYRSVVVFGTARVVEDPAEKDAALVALVEHVLPGRTGDTRPPSRKELAATTVLALRIDEASAKVRTGPPVEEPEDEVLPYWGGVVPLRLSAAAPVADPLVPAGLAPPAYIKSYRRPAAHSSSGLSHFS